MFGEKSEEVLKRSASDEMYLKSLKDKIQQNVKKTKKNMKSKEEPILTIQEPKKEEPQPRRNDEMSQLKLKEKERKRKKQDAAFQQKIETSVDKVKDMSLKSQKLEKISVESENELRRIKEMSTKLVARSQANEEDFNVIFLNLDNLDSVLPDKTKKKGKKGLKTESKKSSILEAEVHWTEEENNKWSTEKKEVARVTNLLAAMRQAAAAGDNTFVTASIQDAINNCKKMQDEHEKDRQAELLERQSNAKMEADAKIEEEKRRKAEAAKAAKESEEMAKQEKKKKEEEKRVAEEKALQEAKKKADEEAARKMAEEEQTRKKAEEAAALKKSKEEEEKKKAKEEAARKKAEEEAARKK